MTAKWNTMYILEKSFFFKFIAMMYMTVLPSEVEFGPAKQNFDQDAFMNSWEHNRKSLVYLNEPPKKAV